MKYFLKLSTTFLLLLVIGLICDSMQTKKVDCRKYVYAPVCRGVAAKRVFPKYPHREMGDSVVVDLEAPIQWKDKDRSVNEKGLFRMLFPKLESKTADYENENMENDLD